MRWLPGLLLLLLSTSALAQHNNRSGRDLQFRFGNPGARSLAFGGAFLALADDATAPVANPAGSVRTAKRSVAFELNYNRQENEIPFASGDILQTNVFEFNYNFTGGKVPESTYQIPYLALIVPSGKWRYGFYLQQQANMTRSYENEALVYCHLNSPGYPDCVDLPHPNAFPPSSEYLNIEMVNGGGTLAYAIRDNISVGVSLFYSHLDYEANSLIYFEQFAGDSIISRLARGKDEAFGATLGALWKPAEDFSLGATYKIQPEFDYTATMSSTVPVPNTPADFSRPAIFKIPDSIGLGVSLTPMDQLTLNMDANRIYYSQITDHLVDFSQIRTAQSEVLQTMSDVTELHIGAEWIYLGLAHPLSLRLGYWLNPYHAPVNNVDDSQILEGSQSDPTVRDIFFLHLFEEDEHHYSGGFGYTFNEKWQLDMAADFGTKSTDVTLSGIYRF